MLFSTTVWLWGIRKKRISRGWFSDFSLERLGGIGIIYHQVSGGVLREDGFSYEAAEVDVSMSHPRKGCLGRVGSVGLMPSLFPSRMFASQSASELTDLKR